MEQILFYVEDCNGGFYADAEYMETQFDSSYQSLICTGTKEEIDAYIGWACNNEPQEELCQCQALGEYLIETEDGIKYVYIPPTIH